MKVDPTEYPVLVAENYFDTSDKKDKVTSKSKISPQIMITFIVHIVVRNFI